MTGNDDRGALYLGLDASTQALKATIIDSLLFVVGEVEVRFDSDLPHFKTKGGTIPPAEDTNMNAHGEIHSPVAMLVEAFDILFDRIKQANWPVGRVASISAAGQQHASVYWSHGATAALASASDPCKKLAEQVTASAFSRQTVPSWQDSSTLAQCRALEAHFPDGVGGLTRVTGSRAHARFTGPQIMRFRMLSPEAYKDTERISLVSSFVTTLLCLDGEIKPLDESDACGMNMWDVTLQRWSDDALGIISGNKAAELGSKLGSVELDAAKPVGFVSSWLQRRYGFAPQCTVCTATGDNPATLLSFSLDQGEALVSLGTSDTLLVSTNQYFPHEEYHAFAHPAQTPGQTKRYFNMLVYKNGSLAREYVRDRHFRSSWDVFNDAITQSYGTNDFARTGFWWLKPEIIPANAKGTYKFEQEKNTFSSPKLVDEFTDESANARAILESQFSSFRVKSSSILSPASKALERAGTGSENESMLKRVFASGGASKNLTLLKVLANVMGCDVVKPLPSESGTEANACSVGAAYKAAWSHARKQNKTLIFDDFIGALRAKRADPYIVTVARPDWSVIKMVGYDIDGLDRWKVLETKALAKSTSSPS